MSKAQELEQLRIANGEKIKGRDFQLMDNAETLESYYENIISEEEIEAALLEYEGATDAVDKEFGKRTQLRGYDIGFLFFATMLQCLRIYVLNPMIENLTEIEKANSHGGKEDYLHDMQDKIFQKFKTDKNPVNKDMYASMESIIATRGVPYDATRYGDVKYKIFKGANHRFATLGHDPLLGLVFGTANILTNTITCVDDSKWINSLNTHYVDYDIDLRNPRIGLPTSTIVMLKAACERLENDKPAVAAAVIKQLIHIATDLYTPAGISLPGANLILSKANVEKLTQYISTGDLLKVGASAGIAILINTLITAIHGCVFLFQEGKDDMQKELYHIRTKKIILYSNLLATSSNVIATGFGKTKFDIGGFLVTCERLFSDTRFIDKIKYEFLNSQVSKIYEENIEELEIYY